MSKKHSFCWNKKRREREKNIQNTKNKDKTKTYTKFKKSKKDQYVYPFLNQAYKKISQIPRTKFNKANSKMFMKKKKNIFSIKNTKFHIPIYVDAEFFNT